jgi:hypothetical protein
MKYILSILATTTLFFFILIRFFGVQTIFVDVYPVPTYKKALTVQKEFSKFDAEFISWSGRCLDLKVRVKSIDTLMTYLSGYEVISRNGNNNVTVSPKEIPNEN